MAKIRSGLRTSEAEDGKRKNITWASLKKSLRLFKYVRPYLGTFLLGLLFLFLSSITSMVFPYLTGQLVDAAKESLISEINEIALILLGIFFLNAVFSYFRIYLFAIVTQHTLASLRQATYNHLSVLKMEFFASRRVGELTSRISADISLLQETLTTTLAEFLRQILTIGLGIGLLVFISPKLTLLMLALIPVVMVVAVIFGRKIRRLAKETQDQVADSNVIVEETLQAIAIVKAFVNEAFERNRYKIATDKVIGIALRAARWRAAFASFIIFCLFGSIVGVIWYGVILVQQAQMTIGDLLTFILYSVFVGASMGGIADLYSQLQKAIGATENLLELFDQQPETTQDQKSSAAQIEKGAVVFEGVEFSYPSRPANQVLKGISFSIDAGENVAVVGPSGAGKTTLTALIFRFYNPTAGQILIDGRPNHTYDLHTLRESMAIVPQDVILFGGTIKENIAYGKTDATDAEIIAAAKQANAHEFIASFGEGYETLVGERGIQLSGGQRQRIAIARAILKDPRILLLDEATSSLDSQSEQLVQQALESLMKNRTSIVIAHRLSTVQNADKIIVLEKGEIVEAGSPATLEANKEGLYSRLKEMQMH
jgi:ABC-type multidrug transport system fused ATPase/permease subunit